MTDAAWDQDQIRGEILAARREMETLRLRVGCVLQSHQSNAKFVDYLFQMLKHELANIAKYESSQSKEKANSVIEAPEKAAS